MARPRTIPYKPPDPSVLEEARANRFKEMKMWDIIREITLYTFFLWILLVISYSFRDPDAFLFKKNIQTMFVDQGLGHLPAPFTYTKNFDKVMLSVSLRASARKLRRYSDGESVKVIAVKEETVLSKAAIIFVSSSRLTAHQTSQAKTSLQIFSPQTALL